MKFKILSVLALSTLLACNSTLKENTTETTEATTVEGTVNQSPEVSFKKIDGDIVNVSSLKDKVVFVNFWATWCGPCKVEMPSLQAFYNKYQSNPNVEFLVVEVDNKPDLAKEYIAENKYTFPIYSPASMLPPTFLGQAIPTTLILDKQGNITYRHEGTSDFMDDRFINLFEGVLNK